jgi:superfamily II DNA or RNA helicase
MVIIDYNSNTNKIQIKSDDIDLFDELRTHFSVKNEGAQFARARLPKFKQKFVPDRKYMITPTGQCLSGLYGEIRQWLVEKQVTDVEFTPEFQKYIDNGLNYEIYNSYNVKELRYYQKDFLKRGLRSGRGVCILGTGGGKTLICASLIDSVFRAREGKLKGLLIVPNLGLVTQTYNDFTEYGVKFSFTRWTGKQTPDLSSDVIICNSAILLRRFDQSDWVRDVDLVLVDEVHALSNTNKITKCIDKIKTTHKFGFTGTLPENLGDRWNVIGVIGPVIYEKSSDELRTEGFLVNAEVRRVEITYKSKISVVHTEAYQNELDFIYYNEYRNKVIKNICDKYSKNVLILVNHIRHGEELLRILSKAGRDVYFIHGNIDVADRIDVIKRLEESDGVVCIAISNIFSTGINILNLHMLIFAAGGKSFIRTVQSIGRGLRLHPSKTTFTIIDICDMLHYNGEHAAKRLHIYDKEKIPHKTLTIQENG